jgi:hypothetical protein
MITRFIFSILFFIKQITMINRYIILKEYYTLKKHTNIILSSNSGGTKDTELILIRHIEGY